MSKWTRVIPVILSMACLMSLIGVPGSQAPAARAQNWAELLSRTIPEDQPGEAEQFFRLKRSPDGVRPVPVRRYLAANRLARRMPQHSTALDTMLPSQDEMKAGGSEDLMSLGTWTQLGPGNIGGRTRAILINPTTPTTMYAAGVAGGIWKTTNGGASWAPLADLLSNIAVNSMAMDPANSDVIYAGTGEGYFNGDSERGLGIFKSTDAGANWALLANTGNSNFWYVNTLIVSPNNSQRVYAGTNAGIWRSLDGGATWTQVFNPGLNGCFDLKIRTDQPTDYILASIGTFAQAQVYRNTDAAGSGTWNSVLTEPAMGLTSLAIAPSSQSIMYALASANNSGPPNYQLGLDAVFRSTDGGGTWAARVRNSDATKLNTLLLTNPIEAMLSECKFIGSDAFINQGWYDNVIAVDPIDPNKVWVGGIDLFRSDDGGANWGLASYWWSNPAAPPFVHADQHAIVFHPQYNGTTNQILFVGNDGGIFRSTNARAATANGQLAACSPAFTSVQWSSLNNNYGVTQFYYGAVYPSGTEYFGGTQDNGTPRGTDGGGLNAWSSVLGGDGGAVAVDRTVTSNLYAENTGLSIKKSTDGGSNFFPATTGITEDGADFLFIAPFIMDPGNTSRLYTGGFFMWRTADGGASWSQASDITPGNGSVSAIAVAPTNANNAVAGLSDGFIVRTNVATTSNSSTVWQSAQPRSGYVAGLAFDPSNASVVYATYSSFNSSITDHHVYKSTDAGATWNGIDGSGAGTLPDIPTHTIAVDPHNSSTLYVGTDIGVFVTLNGGASWARENTGFANVITDSLVINTVASTSTLFAFTHGRGAWRVVIPSGSLNPTTAGIYQASTGTFFLRFTSGAGPADLTFQFGPGGLIPLTGDWNGDGVTTIGLYSPATGVWFLKNSNSAGPADLTFQYGPAGAGWLPVVGDWNGDGVDTIGLYNPATSTFFLRNSNSAGPADLTFSFGPAASGWKPIVGDWNGDHIVTVGLYDPATSIFFLKNSNAAGPADLTFSYGPAASGWTPVVGDWDGDGIATIGLFAPSTATWFLRNTNAAGPADLVFQYGFPATPVTGRWH